MNNNNLYSFEHWNREKISLFLKRGRVIAKIAKYPYYQGFLCHLQLPSHGLSLYYDIGLLGVYQSLFLYVGR